MANYLVSGDSMEPCSSDLIVQTTSLPVGEPVPEGWRVLSGSTRYSQIARVVMCYEIEEED